MENEFMEHCRKADKAEYRKAKRRYESFKAGMEAELATRHTALVKAKQVADCPHTTLKSNGTFILCEDECVACGRKFIY